MSGAYATAGAKLIERGYSAIPIMPQTKRPGYLRGGEWIGMSDWQAIYSKRLPTQFEIDRWSATDAGVCVVCGKGSKDLIGIDLDTDHPELLAAFDALLPATPLRKRGATGETRFYRGRPVSRSYNLIDPAFRPAKVAKGKPYRVCDIIGDGRQTVLPPTVHPDTQEPFKWIGGAALEDFDPDDLPIIDDDIADQIATMLTRFGYKEEPKGSLVRDPGDGDTPHRMLNEYALANLEAWVPKLGLYRCRRRHQGYEAVPTWRSSNRGTPIEKRKLNLKIAPDGINDFGDGPKGYTPIDVVIASQGCDLDTAVRFLADATAWGSSGVTIALKAKPAKDISDLPVIETHEKVDIDIPISKDDDGPKPGEPIVTSFDPDDDYAADVPAALLESNNAFDPLTHAPGLLGDLIDWIVATARRPNRVMALGAAATTIGTLIGRRVAGPTRSGTHLYCVTLAPTGTGKQHPLNCIMRAMTAAKAAHHIGPSEFVSMTAFINMLLKKPLAICPQDEFGAFLARVNGRNASSHEAGISKVMRSAWGASFEALPTPEWASRQSEIIRAPAISIYGMSTHDEFYESLQGRDVTNGFLNRFLILSTHDRVHEVETTAAEPGKVPARLADALQELYAWGGNSLSTSRLNDPSLDPEPYVMAWANDAAKKKYRDLSQHVEAQMASSPELEPFIARTAEIGLRLATICAAGRLGPGATLDLKDMQWGADVALASAEMMASDALKRMVVEMSHGKIANRLLELLSKKGRTKKRDLLRAIGSGVKSRDFDDAMKFLSESGQIEIEKTVPPSGGTPTLWLKIAA